MPGFKDEPPAEVPDLIVESPSAPPPVRRSARVEAPLELDPGALPSGSVPSAEGAPPSFGGFELSPEIDFFEPEQGPALDLGWELEAVGGPPAAPVVSRPSPGRAAPSSGPQSTPGGAPTPWPTGATPGPEELAVDEEEIRRLADFGPPPIHWLLSPPYAVRVWRRRRVLRALGAEAELSLGRAEAARDERLAHLAEQVRPLLLANDRYHSLVRDLEAQERLLQEREAAVNQSDAGLHAATAELEARERALGAERAIQERARAAAQQVVDEIEETRGRLSAQCKRIDIERRALLDVARRKLGPAGGELPAELATTLAELDRKSEALRPDVERVREELGAARGKLAEAERALELSDLELQRIHSQKTMRLTERQDELTRCSQELERGRREYQAALADVGRTVLGMKGHVPVDEGALDPLRQLDDRVRIAAREAHRLRLAPLACDADAVRRGWWLMAASAAALGIVPWLL